MAKKPPLPLYPSVSQLRRAGRLVLGGLGLGSLLAAGTAGAGDAKRPAPDAGQVAPKPPARLSGEAMPPDYHPALPPDQAPDAGRVAPPPPAQVDGGARPIDFSAAPNPKPQPQKARQKSGGK